MYKFVGEVMPFFCGATLAIRAALRSAATALTKRSFAALRPPKWPLISKFGKLESNKPDF